MLTEQDVLTILHSLKDSTGQSFSERVTVESIISDAEIVKLRIHISNIDAEEKKIFRRMIEKSFSDKGIDVLVTIVSDVQDKSTKKIQEMIPLSLFQKFKKIIAIYSTKGGVGKSTIAVQLALEMSSKGLKVALVDLDIYGPSIPRILGIKEKIKVQNQQFIPPQINGIHMMSVGLLLPSVQSPLIWRAPIVNGVIQQIFTDTLWDDNYDILIIDMPPGTGDIPILVAQSIPLDGVVAVSTPQSVALEDTVKGLVMFQKFNVPILGLIYNMGSVVCTECSKHIPIFPKTEEFTEVLVNLNINILADLPLDTSVAALADQGMLQLVDSNTVWKKEFQTIVAALV